MSDNINVYNNTFSGTDMIASIVFPNCAPITIGEMATASYSIYREKNPVRTLSRITVKGFSKGTRTVAGTLIFTVFDKHVVNRIRSAVPYLKDMVRIKTDELPPFDLYITMGNEYGGSARINIYGLTIVDEGKVLSVEDLFTENQWSYMARDIDLMDEIGAEQNKPLTEFRAADEINGSFTADTLVMDNTFKQMQKELQAYKDAQKAKVTAERAAELKKYTYDIPDISYKPTIEVNLDADGGLGDTTAILTDEEKAHLYDVNRPQLEVAVRHVKDKQFDDAYNSDNSVRSIKVVVRADGRLALGTPFLDGVTIGIDIAFNDDTGHYVRDYVGQGSVDGSLTVILDIKNYHKWTPVKPTLIVYVAKDHRNLKDKAGVPYYIIGENTKTISIDSEGRPDNAIDFIWVEEGTKAESTILDMRSLKLKIEAEGFGQVIDKHAVKIYRDAHVSGSKNSDGSYNTMYWVTPDFLKWNTPIISIGGQKDYTGVKKAKINSGFKIWITDIKKDGKYFSFDKAAEYLDRIQISCDILIGLDLGKGETVITNGSQANANSFTGISDDKFHDSFKFYCTPLKGGNYEEFYVFKDLHLVEDGNLFAYFLTGSFALVATHSKLSNAIQLSSLKATLKNWKAVYTPYGIGKSPISIGIEGPELKVAVDVLTTETLNEVK